MINLCICDDDNELCIKLQSRIYQYAEHCGISVRIRTYSDSALLIRELEHDCPYQIYFLDVLMPLVSGLELAHQIRLLSSSAQIVFLTSSPEFALDAYDVYACGYLLKPVPEDKLCKTLDHAFGNTVRQKEPLCILKTAGTIRTVSYSSVVYLESFHNHTSVHLNSGETIDNAKSMGEMESLLVTHPEFLRVHRSYIVNMNYIREMSAGELRLSADSHVPISKNLQSAVRMSYFDFMERMV